MVVECRADEDIRKTRLGLSPRLAQLKRCILVRYTQDWSPASQVYEESIYLLALVKEVPQIPRHPRRRMEMSHNLNRVYVDHLNFEQCFFWGCLDLGWSATQHERLAYSQRLKDIGEECTLHLESEY
jgi:hypothetical protein